MLRNPSCATPTRTEPVSFLAINMLDFIHNTKYLQINKKIPGNPITTKSAIRSANTANNITKNNCHTHYNANSS